VNLSNIQVDFFTILLCYIVNYNLPLFLPTFKVCSLIIITVTIYWVKICVVSCTLGLQIVWINTMYVTGEALCNVENDKPLFLKLLFCLISAAYLIVMLQSLVHNDSE